MVGHMGHGHLATYVLRGFRALGLDAVAVEDQELIPRTYVGRRVSEAWPDSPFNRRLDAVNEECLHTVVVKSPYLGSRNVRGLRRTTSGSLVLWLPDDPFLALRPAVPRSLLRRFDIIVTYSERIAERLRDVGCPRVIAVPFGHDPEDHFPAPAVEPDIDVVFVGQYSPHRARTIDVLLESGFRVRVFGSRWSDADRNVAAAWDPRRVFGSAVPPEYARARVGLNILHPQNNRGSHNMRSFELPAMGVSMVTTDTDEQRRLLAAFQQVAYYRTDHELVQAVQSLQDLPRPKPRESALAATSYAARCSTLLDTLATL